MTGGSAASPWCRACWARPSARCTSSRTSPPAPKARMEELVANLVAAYRESIFAARLGMGEETRAKALAKLEAFTPKIGYPARWRDYGTLEVTADDLLGNVSRANAFEQDRELGKIGKPIDRDEWFHDAADRQRVLQPRHERDRVPPRSSSRRSSTPRPTTRPTTAASGRSSTAIGSSIDQWKKVRRRRTGSRTGGRPRTAPSSRPGPRRSSTSTRSSPPCSCASSTTSTAS